LDDKQARLSELRQTIGVLQWELKQADNPGSNADNNDRNDISDASAVEMKKQKKYYEDPEWRGLDRNVRTIQHQIATSLFTRKHPDRIKAEMDLKFVPMALVTKKVYHR
jgi:hypothetical protein